MNIYKAILLSVLFSIGYESFGQKVVASIDVKNISNYRIDTKKYNEDTFINVLLLDQNDQPVESFSEILSMRVNEENFTVQFVNGAGQLKLPQKQGLILTKMQLVTPVYKLFYFKPSDGKNPFKPIPFWLSILPPLLAIFFALIFREVIISLFAGIWFGAFIVNGMSLNAILSGLFDVIDHYIIKAITDPDKAAIVVFSLLIGGMVAIISRNGGMTGIVNRLSLFARSAKSSQFITWFIGIAIFFDDYANTLIVGNTMRPVTDKFRVSREKLAYIVDSTAAPVAAIAFFTTWIGAELGYIEGAVESLNLHKSAYTIFFNSLAYSYYPVLTLLFIFLIIRFKKDYGPMYSAELRARNTGQLYKNSLKEEGEQAEMVEELTSKHGIKESGWFAFVPITVLVGTVIYALLFYQGSGSIWSGSDSILLKLQKVIGDADSYQALMWGSSAGVVVAIGMSILGRKLTIRESLEALMTGFKTMMTAIIILVLAWSLAQITEDLHTADYLISKIPDDLSAYWFPLITFVLSAIVSFATGSSWGTMAILYPICLPITYYQAVGSGLEANEFLPIIYNVTSVVLAGSVFGDHCSPISDTTILSSLASQCDHIEHVRTQLPYALTVGLISIFTGGIMFALKMPWWLGYIVGIGLIALVIFRFGKEVPEHADIRRDSQLPD